MINQKQAHEAIRAMAHDHFEQMYNGISGVPISAGIISGPVSTSDGNTLGANISIAEALMRSRGSQEKSAPRRVMAPTAEVVDIEHSRTEAEKIKKAAHREQARARMHNHLRDAVSGLNSLITSYAEDFGDDVLVEIEDGRIVLYTKTRIA